MLTLNLYNGDLGLNLKSLKKIFFFWRRSEIVCLKATTFWHTIKVGSRVAVCYQSWVLISKIILIPDFYQTATLMRDPRVQSLITFNDHDHLFS